MGRVDAAPRADELWSAILADRAAAASPRGLVGTISISIDERSFHIRCDDNNGVQIVEGPADDARARVVSTEPEVHAMLFAPEPPAGALRVEGDFAFFTAVFEALARVPAPTDWLGVRGAR